VPSQALTSRHDPHPQCLTGLDMAQAQRGAEGAVARNGARVRYPLPEHERTS
jgi:hypothetical protein